MTGYDTDGDPLDGEWWWDPCPPGRIEALDNGDGTWTWFAVTGCGVGIQWRDYEAEAEADLADHESGCGMWRSHLDTG